LGALIVPESVWLALEKDLQVAVEKSFPSPRPDDFEIHATEISNPRNGYFKQHGISHRLAFRDEWFRLAQKHALKFVYRAIAKKRFLEWSHTSFGTGVAINPHVAAFPLVARVVDDYLKSLPVPLIDPFIHVGDERFRDVNAWLTAEQKKGRPGN
jgi:hypothetical protein